MVSTSFVLGCAADGADDHRAAGLSILTLAWTSVASLGDKLIDLLAQMLAGVADFAMTSVSDWDSRRAHNRLPGSHFRISTRRD
jgi:hypothetical protein